MIQRMRSLMKTEQIQPVFAAPTVPDLLQVREEKDHIIAEQQKLLRLMEEKLRLAKLQRFGASSEKLAFQGDFFDEAELEAPLSDLEQQLADDQPPPKRARKKRTGFSDQLPRVRGC